MNNYYKFRKDCIQKSGLKHKIKEKSTHHYGGFDAKDVLDIIISGWAQLQASLLTE